MTIAMENGVQPPFNNLIIGKFHGTPSDSEVEIYQGQVGEVRIWDHVRDKADLDRLKDEVLEGNESGLMAYLPIDEGRGTTLHNLANAANNGILEIATEDPATKWVDADGLPVRPGLVFQFDEDMVVLPSSESLQLTNSPYTIETWVNIPDLSGEYPILGSRGPLEDPAADSLVFSLKKRRAAGIFE